MGDLAHQPIYNVHPKRAYSIDILIGDATRLFSQDVRESLTDDEILNVEQAGRCLAFELPTAAAFHIFRALDSVLRRYCREVKGALPRSKNWGNYIKELDAGGVAPKITGVLNQIKDFHRNPVIHEETLNMEEALSLVGVAETGLSAMVRDINARGAAKKAATIPPSGIASLPAATT